MFKALPFHKDFLHAANKDVAAKGAVEGAVVSTETKKFFECRMIVEGKTVGRGVKINEISAYGAETICENRKYKYTLKNGLFLSCPPPAIFLAAYLAASVKRIFCF